MTSPTTVYKRVYFHLFLACLGTGLISVIPLDGKKHSTGDKHLEKDRLLFYLVLPFWGEPFKDNSLDDVKFPWTVWPRCGPRPQSHDEKPTLSSSFLSKTVEEQQAFVENILKYLYHQKSHLALSFPFCKHKNTKQYSEATVCFKQKKDKSSFVFPFLRILFVLLLTSFLKAETHKRKLLCPSYFKYWRDMKRGGWGGGKKPL